MNKSYFHGIQTRSQPRIRGVQRALLGHKLQYDNDHRPDGIYAEWVWDGNRLIVRNDRYGFYPLFYYWTQDEIIVSPCISTLVSEGASTELDFTALAVFLRLGFFVGEDTPFLHIKALAPGSTIKWPGPLEIHSDGYIFGKSTTVSCRKTALDDYITLFRQSIKRRLPQQKQRFAVPLSGGRDSRHILFELLHQGQTPDVCVTTPKNLHSTDEDVRVASLLARTLDLPLTTVEQTLTVFESEFRRNSETSFCSDKHAWYMAIADDLHGRDISVYDGIAGDVLSQSQSLTPQLLNLFETGATGRIASALLGNRHEKMLTALLKPNILTQCSRESAIARLQTEIAKHLDAPNPVSSFLFWNRTRREIALIPYGILGSLKTVYAPYLDRDLYEFLAALPAGFLLDRRFHTDAMQAAFPDYSHIEFNDNSEQIHLSSPRISRLSRSLAGYLLTRMPFSLMRSDFLLPRLVANCFNSKHNPEKTWFASSALYLGQLESLTKRNTSVFR